MQKPFYIAQDDGGSCGAAALAMVLGQFGTTQSPQKIAGILTRIGQNGQPGIRTHDLANYARGLGFSCLVAQFSDPWLALVRSYEAGFGVIINHRLDRDKPTGHFSVLSGILTTENTAIIHDPQRGPDQRKTRDELIELWSPNYPGSQIAGSVGVVIAPRPIGGVPCVCPSCSQFHDKNIPVKCPGCSIILEPLPGFILGCLSENCSRKLWRRLFCPNCDRVWTGQSLQKINPIRQNIDESFDNLTKVNVKERVTKTEAVAGEGIHDELIDKPNEPEEDLSALKLAEALKSLPLPDWGAIAALAESQKQILTELSEISEFGNDLSDRAKEWDQATDEIRRDSAQLESYRNQLSSDLEAAANSAKAKAENAKKVSEAIPATEEKSNDKPDTEENTESSVKQPLLTGPELVNRLMKMVKRKS
jgi:hypothetical protein